jgi:uncharacterized membrane protein
MVVSVAGGVAVAGAVLAHTGLAAASPTSRGTLPARFAGESAMPRDPATPSPSMSGGSTTGAMAGDHPMSTTVRRHGAWRFRTVDDPADPTFNQLLGINNTGRIVGYFGSGTDAAHPNKGFRVRKPFTGFVNENVPGPAQTHVVGVNNMGATVGFSVDPAGASTGFVYSHGKFTAVTDPLTDRAHPVNQLLGVNDRGVAVGFYNDARGAAHSYTHDVATGSFTPIRLPVQADAVTAAGINNEGDIAGFYTVGQKTSGFRLEHNGHFQTLSFGSGANTQALGINRAEQVVGAYVDTAGTMHGFLWSKGRLTAIDDPMGARGSLVNGLNDRGQLVGFYVDTAGLTHGFLADRQS